MKKTMFPSFLKSLSFTTEVNAGIVIGYTSLTLVVARCFSDREHDILAWGKESYGDGINRNSPEFPAVLKAILSRYLKHDKKIRIWCMIQSKGVETRFLVLPDMPARHRPQAVFWSFKKEVGLTNQDVVFDFDVTGSSLSQDKKELEVMACSAPVKELQDIKALFKACGFPLTGITVTSFAFQNLFRTGFAGQGSEQIGTLFIGTDWSRIDIFSKGTLILSRDIKTGTRSMTEVIEEQIRNEQKQEISIDAYLEAEDISTDDESAVGKGEKADSARSLPVGTQLFSEMILAGDPQRLDHAFDRVHPVVDRLIRQIERTFEHFTMTSKGKRVERLYFTGPLCAFGPLLTYTEKQLGIPVSTLSPFDSEKGDTPQRPARIIEHDEFVPAAGLALSSPSHTLNFNFTYKDKATRRLNRALSRWLALAIFAVAVAGVVTHLGMQARNESLGRTVTDLSGQLAGRALIYGEPGVLAMVETIKAVKARFSGQARTHKAAAVLAELSLMVPRHIRLTAFEYHQTENPRETVTLNGLLLHTDKTGLDGFIAALETSPLIHTVTLTHVNKYERDKGTVHYFESILELE